MNSTIFDDITRAFVSTLEAGTVSLGVYSIPLLSAMALIGWYWQHGRSLALGGAGLGDALAGAVLYAVNIGVAYWLVTNLTPLATAAYQTFLQWGMAAGGNTAASVLVTPSAVVDLGFQVAKPIQDWTLTQTGWSAMWNISQLMFYDLAATAIILSFPLVAVALMVTVIEFHLSVMLGAILIPFSVFGPTAFLTEFCIGWITGSLLRVLTTAALVGVGFPLFSTAVTAMTAGGDPTKYSAMIVAMVAMLYAGMSWWIPNKAAHMCGRVAIGLSASTVVGGVMGGAMGGTRVVMAGAQAIRGVSTMIQGRSK